jgi:hypothetical protein
MSYNTLQINNESGSNSLAVEPSGLVVIPSLALIDEKTGNKWLIKIVDGELTIVPVELEDKRNFKINSLLNGGI